MKLLFDFFPIALFFVTFKLYDDPQQGILAATAVMMVATVAQVGYTWFRHRKVEKMHVITLVLVMVFGGITLVLKEGIYIQWKPTAVNWLFAVAFLGSEFIGKKSLIKRLMESKIDLPEPIWTRLNLSWVAFFVLMGAVNLYVVYNYDEATWVNFKLFGVLGLTLVFMVAQGFYLARHVKEDETEESSG